MTTMTHPKLNRITALRDQANHPSTGEAEAAAFLAKAREMCTKYGIDPAVLDEPTKQTTKPIINGQAPQEKRFTCRFGCGFFVSHTIDELNACAERARNANGGNAYAGQTKARDPFEDLFGKGYADAGPAPKARATGTHKYCDHEATKSARARCRKARGY